MDKYDKDAQLAGLRQALLLACSAMQQLRVLVIATHEAIEQLPGVNGQVLRKALREACTRQRANLDRVAGLIALTEDTLKLS